MYPRARRFLAARAIPAASLIALFHVIALAWFPAPCGAVGVRSLPLIANDVVYNAHDGFLYVSVPGTDPNYGNTVTRVDPITGAIGPYVHVGSEPRKLALSDDGVTLYVALDGAAAIRRVGLSPLAAGLQFSLGNSWLAGPRYAEDIEVLPGSPNAVAVALRNQGFSPRHEGVAIFDNGVQRPTQTAVHTGSNIIAFSANASRLYGQNIETTEFGFRRMDVTASGVTVVDVTEGLLSTFGAADGQGFSDLYFTFPNFLYGAAVAPDGGRAFFATSSFGTGSCGIHVFDALTFTSILNYDVAALGIPTVLRRWGTDGLAMRMDTGALYLLDDVLDPPTCDLVLTITDDRDPVAVGDQFLYRLKVVNRGETVANNVFVRNPIPALTSYAYSFSTRGGCYDSLGTVVCNTFAIPPRDSVEITLALNALAEGQVVNRASVVSDTRDANAANNVAEQRTEVRPAGFDQVDVYVAFETPPPTEVVEGVSIDHHLIVGNRSRAEARAIRLTGFGYGAQPQVTVLSSPGFCTAFEASMGCSLATLGPGAVARVALRWDTRAAGVLSVQYAVFAEQQEANYSDNIAGAFHIVQVSASKLLDSLVHHIERLDLHRGPEKGLTRKLASAASKTA